MKKRFVLFATIIAIITVMCSFGVASAFADEGATEPAKPYIVSFSTHPESITKGTSAAYTVEVKKLLSDGTTYATITDYVEDNFVFQFTYDVKLVKNGSEDDLSGKACKISGNVITVDTTSLDAGDYVLKVAVKKGATILDASAATSFSFKVAKAKTNPTTWIFLIVAALLIVGIFVYSSRSNKKRQRQAQSVADNLALGDKVKTIGGICGVVVEINHDENTFVLESGSANHKTYTKFDKAAVYQTAKPNQSFEQAAQEQAAAPAKEEKPARHHGKKGAPVTEETPADEKPTEETPAKEETPVDVPEKEETAVPEKGDDAKEDKE